MTRRTALAVTTLLYRPAQRSSKAFDLASGSTPPDTPKEGELCAEALPPRPDPRARLAPHASPQTAAGEEAHGPHKAAPLRGTPRGSLDPRGRRVSYGPSAPAVPGRARAGGGEPRTLVIPTPTTNTRRCIMMMMMAGERVPPRPPRAASRQPRRRRRPPVARARQGSEGAGRARGRRGTAPLS